MEKKYKVLIILVIILSLLVVGLGGFILYDKVLSNNEVENNINDTNNDRFEDNNTNDTNNNDENVSDDDLFNQYKDKITNSIWYKTGTVFSFRNEKTTFSIGKYASDGGHGGNLNTFKDYFLGSKKYRFEIEAVADACTDTANCINITNGYVLQVELEYDGNSTDEITLTKITKTEDGVVESFDALKGVYHFAGTNWDEVYNYVDNLRNSNN